MKVIAIVLFLLLLSCCKPRRPDGGRYVGIDRSTAACSVDRTAFYRQTCISGGRIYTCLSDTVGVWVCAPTMCPAQLPMEKNE